MLNVKTLDLLENLHVFMFFLLRAILLFFFFFPTSLIVR